MRHISKVLGIALKASTIHQKSIIRMASELTFVTGNANKLREVKELVGPEFPFTIKNEKIDLPEYQGEADDISRNKCKEACKKVKGAVLVEDTCLCFNAMDGLPGPYIKWFLDKIGSEGLDKMLHGFDDKSAVAVCTLAFVDSEKSEVLLFKGEVQGTIVSPRGDNNFGWDNCFQPKGRDKTFAEMNSTEKNEISHRRRAIEALRKHFCEEKSPKKRKQEEESNGESEATSPVAKKRKPISLK